jgi:type IV secretion system protein VirB10
MRQRISPFLFILLLSSALTARLAAQEPSGEPLPAAPAPPPVAVPLSPSAPAPASTAIVVPVGTRLPLVLRNGINTRTAKAGDSVYFETAYPIAANNRMVIPMGTFARGEILEAKRPGRIKGRGEFRIVLNQLTYANGYTVNLRATPSSVDRDGREKVSPEGKVTGPGGVGKDVGTVALATAIGGPVGGYAGLLAGSPSRASLAIGHGIGAAAGLALVLMTRGPEAELPRGTTVDVVFDRPLVLDAAYLPAWSGAGTDPQVRTMPAPPDARRELKEMQKRRMQQSMFRSLPLLFLLH